MEIDFLQSLKHLGFTARIKRLNERIVSSTVSHYERHQMDIDPNWHVIFLLLKSKGPLTVTEIASSLGFSHPAMIKITRKMREHGYLDMYKDPKDGRKTCISLSEKGKDVLPYFEKEWENIRTVLQEVVSPDFLKQLTELENALDNQSFSERYNLRFGQNSPATDYTIRNALPSEFTGIGKLLVSVYSNLEGFPKANEQPEYYESLANIGEFTHNPGVELLVALSNTNQIWGAILYFSDMTHYGAPNVKFPKSDVSGFRLLAVDPSARGKGIGRALSNACIEKAKKSGHKQVLIHSTAYMKPAQRMYKQIGFKRHPQIDFILNGLEVYGFRLQLA